MTVDLGAYRQGSSLIQPHADALVLLVSNRGPGASSSPCVECGQDLVVASACSESLDAHGADVAATFSEASSVAT